MVSNATRSVPRIARPDGSGNKGVHYDANMNLPVVSAAHCTYLCEPSRYC